MTEVHFGWDASNWDWGRGQLDLTAAAQAGVVFFTHKAAEGTTYRDPHYREALERARAAGIAFLGAYHVVRTPGNRGPNPAHNTPAGSIPEQVDYFLNYVDASTPWWREFRGWFWQCDLEIWSTKNAAGADVVYDAVAAELGIAWSDLVRERTGRTVLLYASKGHYGDKLTGSRHRLWNANYPSYAEADLRQLYNQHGGETGPGWATYSGQRPVFWQFSSNATIGSQKTCDANAFQGTIQDLWAVINPKAQPPAMGDDMPHGDIPTGFSFNETGDWIHEAETVAVPLPAVGHGPGQWGDAWLYLAGSGEATIRFGSHTGGNWVWADATLSKAAGPAGPLALPAGTDKLLIGRKRRTADDTADGAPARWHVQYAPKN